MATKYRLEATIPEESRVIILSETNMSIEDNQASVSGTYTNEDLTNNSKIILARRPDGETFGYGNVSPVGYQAGPDVPFTETFGGAAETQPDAELWTPDTNAVTYGSLNGTGAWYWSRYAPAGNETPVYLPFNYKITGNFNIEVDVKGSGSAQSTGYTASLYRLELNKPNSGDRIAIGMTLNTIAGYKHAHLVDSLNGTWVSDNDLQTFTDRTPTTYNIYRVNGDTIRCRWKDVVTSWEWDGAPYYESPTKYSGDLTIRMYLRKGSNNSSFSFYFYEMRISDGIITT